MSRIRHNSAVVNATYFDATLFDLCYAFWSLSGICVGSRTQENLHRSRKQPFFPNTHFEAIVRHPIIQRLSILQPLKSLDTRLPGASTPLQYAHSLDINEPSNFSTPPNTYYDVSFVE